VQDQDRGGYFVRLGTTNGPPPVRPQAHETLTVDTPRRRRRFRFSLRPLPVLGLVLLGWLLWAATTPGGISARIGDISDKLQGVVDNATTDPGLKRAATYYDNLYERTGSYPRLSDEDVRDDPEAGWGIGVDPQWCSAHAIVVKAQTGRGTVSRLLLDGKDLGDVDGEMPCPTDLSNPLPWHVPD
jgi:hypothetical protein